MAGLLASAMSAQQVAPEVAALVTAVTDFTVDVHDRLPQQGNLAASPASLALAFLQLHGGAVGETATALHKVLHLPATATSEQLHRATAALVEGRADWLQLVNRLWIAHDLKIEPPFAAAIARNAASGLLGVDFAGDPEKARQIINGEIRRLTDGRAAEALPAGYLRPETGLVATNVLWLRAAWRHRFYESSTAPTPFYLEDGLQVAVPMMRTERRLDYAESDDWQAVRLGLAWSLDSRRNALSAEFVLPRPGKPLQAAERALLAGAIVFHEQRIDLSLPRFELRTTQVLPELLAALGAGIAFDRSRADFSGITKDKNLHLDQVLQEVWVRVDEGGIEATATTAPSGPVTGAIPETEPPQIFRADRRFAFVLRDTATGMILVFGRVENPQLR